MSIGQRVAAWRQVLGFDQTTLAERMNIHSSSISRWEAGITAPGTDNLQKIADGLGITLVQFFGPIPPAGEKGETGAAL